MLRGVVRAACCLLAGLFLGGCGNGGVAPAYHLVRPPSETGGRKLLLYPVARQGDLTAWLTSDHVLPAQRWLYRPGDPEPKYPVVGVIRARDMPRDRKHDGAFLIASGYDGPLFELWDGEAADVLLFTGKDHWIPAKITQVDRAVNSWVRVADGRSIGGWSGYPVVVGDPRHPDRIAGVMWYKSTLTPELGGVTSTRMLKQELARLRFRDFVGP